jgi:response regulator RpfG family c-di-GMP phosphodiesterase
MVFTLCALVYALFGSNPPIEKFVYLFVSAGVLAIAEIQRRIISEIERRHLQRVKTVETEYLSEIESTQREIIFKFSEIAESRSRETGNHVRRVTEYSRILAHCSGLDGSTVGLLTAVSPMHDIGKLGIPETILTKPGPLTDEERALMQNHPSIGHAMLKNSSRDVFRAAAIVAKEHHEKFNGTGYPAGLEGNAIHIFGRITAIADVFDALSSDRCYKRAWEMERVLSLFRQERGNHFDPVLLDIFFSNLDHFLAVRDRFADAPSQSV